MVKKSVLVLSGILASQFATAGTMGPTCTPGDVTVPCETRMWDIGVQALYLKPVYSPNKAYFNTLDSALQPDGDWGYRLEGSWHFSTGNDLTMTWVHYDADTHFTNQGLPLDLAIFPPEHTKLTNKFDQVNLVIGQHVDMGLRKNARFYGGLQYGKISVDTNTFYGLHFLPAPVSFSGYHQTNFEGIGPVLGIDYSYDIANGFSIAANTAATLLYGSSRTSAAVVVNDALVLAHYYAIKRAMVPELEAKLGVNYAHTLGSGMLNLEGGYLAMNYFNALQVPGTLNSDFGAFGPYVGVKWVATA